MKQTPILLLMYNRPEMARKLVSSLAPFKPAILLFAVDGPKAGSSIDHNKVLASQRTVELVDWDCHIETRFRETNLGLRFAVADSVTWAVEKFGRVIVVEDDVVVGPDFIPFMTSMLDRFSDNDHIAHINGYNLVPVSQIENPSEQFRFSIYPESYAWGTWSDKWKLYDESLTWGTECRVGDLSSITGSRVSAIKWKLNFKDAKSERINTWAFRWLASMWSQKQLMVSPNSNLVTYTGQISGTHTRRKTSWHEMPIESPVDHQSELLSINMRSDHKADQWLADNIFKESFVGIAEGITVSIVLEAIKRLNRA